MRLTAKQRAFVKAAVSDKRAATVLPPADLPASERKLLLQLEAMRLERQKLAREVWRLREKCERKDLRLAALRADLTETERRLKYAMRGLTAR